MKAALPLSVVRGTWTPGLTLHSACDPDSLCCARFPFSILLSGLFPFLWAVTLADQELRTAFGTVWNQDFSSTRSAFATFLKDTLMGELKQVLA